MEPLVSVIVPVYNVYPYLREALDSVTGQTYRNLEILVIDDGSTDGSGELCDEYRADPRVRVIHQENRGLSGARNTGLDLMKGEYVTFLDPDDAFHLRMIERLLQALREHDADISDCGYEVFETEGQMAEAGRPERLRAGGEKVLSAREALGRLLTHQMCVCVWNKLYKIQVWESLRFPEGCVYEDIRIMPRVLERCRCAVSVPQKLVYHRKRPNSITGTNSVQHFRDYLDAVGTMQEFLNRLQPPFPTEKIQCFQESSSRKLMLYWADLYYRHPRNRTAEAMRDEIRQYCGEKPQFRQLKSKATRWLFQFCPCAIIPARRCYRQIRHLLGRKRVHAA